jgi:hypothetical protein
MKITLPTPIDAYFNSEKNDDTEILENIFTQDAVVSDESKAHQGLKAIKAWKREGKLKTGYTINPVRADTQGERTLVCVTVVGSFPGSPVKLNYAFTLQHDRIAKLEIH